MKKLLATILAVAMILSLMPMALGEGAQDPITLTVFRGDPGDQPAEDNKIYKLIGSISNNVNQIAVRVNSTNKIYAEDIVNIKEGQDKIWQLLNSLQSKLLRLKR